MNIETATSMSATHPAVIEMQANSSVDVCISSVNSQQYSILVHSVGDIGVLEIRLFKYQGLMDTQG